MIDIIYSTGLLFSVIGASFFTISLLDSHNRGAAFIGKGFLLFGLTSLAISLFYYGYKLEFYNLFW